MVYAAIVAGGKGTRMGADMPKQFLDLGGKPVIIHTINKFLQCDEIDLVYVGVHTDYTKYLSQLCAEHGIDTDRLFITEGGFDRNSTVFAITDAITKNHGISEHDIIVTHDGVRPFVSEREITESILKMRDNVGATVCLPCNDTILFSDDCCTIDHVPDRSKLFRTLTPQTFRLNELIRTYDSLSTQQKSQLTDTASILTSAGIPVAIITGSEYNIKLTTPTDMLIAQTFSDKLLKEEQN